MLKARFTSYSLSLYSTFQGSVRIQGNGLMGSTLGR